MWHSVSENAISCSFWVSALTEKNFMSYQECKIHHIQLYISFSSAINCSFIPNNNFLRYIKMNVVTDQLFLWCHMTWHTGLHYPTFCENIWIHSGSSLTITPTAACFINIPGTVWLISWPSTILWLVFIWVFNPDKANFTTIIALNSISTTLPWIASALCIAVLLGQMPNLLLQFLSQFLPLVTWW